MRQSCPSEPEHTSFLGSNLHARGVNADARETPKDERATAVMLGLQLSMAGAIMSRPADEPMSGDDRISR